MMEQILKIRTIEDEIINVFRQEGKLILINEKTGLDTVISHATGLQTLNIISLLEPFISQIEEMEVDNG